MLLLLLTKSIFLPISISSRLSSATACVYQLPWWVAFHAQKISIVPFMEEDKSKSAIASCLQLINSKKAKAVKKHNANASANDKVSYYLGHNAAGILQTDCQTDFWRNNRVEMGNLRNNMVPPGKITALGQSVRNGRALQTPFICRPNIEQHVLDTHVSH